MATMARVFLVQLIFLVVGMIDILWQIFFTFRGELKILSYVLIKFSQKVDMQQISIVYNSLWQANELGMISRYIPRYKKRLPANAWKHKKVIQSFAMIHKI
jgi:hypothetical protein